MTYRKVVAIVISMILFASPALAQKFLAKQSVGDVRDSIARTMLYTRIPLAYTEDSAYWAVVEVDFERADRLIATTLRHQPEIESVWPQAVNDEKPRLIVRLKDGSEAARSLFTHSQQGDNPVLDFYSRLIYEETGIPVRLKRIDSFRISISVDVIEAENIISSALIDQVDSLEKITDDPFLPRDRDPVEQWRLR